MGVESVTGSNCRLLKAALCRSVGQERERIAIGRRVPPRGPPALAAPAGS